MFDSTIQPPHCRLVVSKKRKRKISHNVTSSFTILPSCVASLAKGIGATSIPIPCCRFEWVNSHPFVDNLAEKQTGVDRDS